MPPKPRLTHKRCWLTLATVLGTLTSGCSQVSEQVAPSPSTSIASDDSPPPTSGEEAATEDSETPDPVEPTTSSTTDNPTTQAAEPEAVEPESPCFADLTTSRDIVYATRAGSEANLTSLDVYGLHESGECGPRPVVVWVHGGGWAVGDKRSQMQDKVGLFHEAGYVFVSVNYRLTNPAVASPVVYPAHNRDVAEAIAWVLDHIDEYGGDPGRLAVLGHSAGASIIATVATDASYLERHGFGLSDIDCVAPLDTEGFDIFEVRSSGRPINDVYGPVFGDDPKTWREASPRNYVQPGIDIPPFLLARRGSEFRAEILDDLVADLEAAGISTITIDANSLTHNEVNDAIGKPEDRVITEVLMEFLDPCLAR